MSRRLSLATRVRRYYARYPGHIPKPWLVRSGVAPRPWDHAVDKRAARVEAIRARFPLDDVRRAARVLHLDRTTRLARLDHLAEQVYRAHTGSMKIAWSWRDALDGLVALAHLVGAVPADDVERWLSLDATRDDERRIARVAIAVVLECLWPDEGLGPILDELDAHPFFGRIQRRVGLLALGARAAFHDYAVAVVRTLDRLHRNGEYSFAHCVGGRPLDWDEACFWSDFVVRVMPSPERRDA